MRVNNLSNVALDSAAAGIEPAISSRKSNALTTAPPSHTGEYSFMLRFPTWGRGRGKLPILGNGIFWFG